MSRAFIREDVDPPERSGRVRSASGLPPGATNYITARGARRLRNELAHAQTANDPERIAELQRILESVTIAEPSHSESKEVAFGATVTIATTEGTMETHTIVGVDELSFEPDGISWISPLGKSLLAGRLGETITVGDRRLGKIAKVEYRGG